MGMSVASEKNELIAWKKWLRFRRFGNAAPGDFSLKQRLTYAGVAALGRLFARTCFDTCHWKVEGDKAFLDGFQQGRRPYIFLMWHNRLPAFFVWAGRFQLRNPRFRMDSIVSSSKDGEFLARIIRENGGGVVRGSSSRDAAQAVRGAIQAIEEGANIATVGDGPRGPRYRLKPGTVMLAKATGAPIIPVTWACNRAFQLHRSWDQLMVPLPFSTIRFRFDAPVEVPADADARAIVEVRRLLESRLKVLTDWADAHTRVAIQLPKPKPGEILKRRPLIELNERRV